MLARATALVCRSTAAAARRPLARAALPAVQRPLVATARRSGGLPAVHARGYHEAIVSHYENPQNVGSLDKDADDVGTGLVGDPACGDVMKLQIKVKDGKVVESKFKTFGCGSAIASSSVATEWAKGKTLDECLTLKNSDIAQHLNLPPVKLHCSMLAEDAIKAAVCDYKAKQEE